MKYLHRLPVGRLFSGFPFKNAISGKSRALPILIGLSVALTGCPEGSTQSPQTITFSEGDELLVQPIQVCNDNGGNCTNVNLFADITRKILEQAKLKVSFLPTNRLNASRFLSINDSRNRNSPDYEFYELTRTGEKGAFGRHPDSTKTSGPINVWFVENIEALGGFTQFGLAWVDANGVLISEQAAEFNNGQGRPDTVAHEIAHNLGLRHASAGTDNNNLLRDGDDRNLPRSVADIGPDGAGVSSLTTAQIKEILNSAFINRSNPGTPGQEVAAADIAALSADEAALLLTQIADISNGTFASGIANLPPQSEFSGLLAQAKARSIPEPAGLIGLSAMGLSFLVLKRERASRR